MWPFTRKKNKKAEQEVILDHVYPVKEERIDTPKSLRASIRECKNRNDFEAEKAATWKLHLYLLQNISKHGTNELDRYPKFLERNGMSQEALEVREKTAEAIKEHSREFRRQRAKQLENFEYVYLRVDDKSPEKCKKLDYVAMLNTAEYRENWVDCDNSPRCYCNMSGLTARAAKRRNIKLPD